MLLVRLRAIGILFCLAVTTSFGFQKSPSNRPWPPGVQKVSAESPVLSGGEPGPHKIEGVGIGYIPPLWEPSLVNTILPVPTDEAKGMVRRLAREEGIFAGTSTGANVLAAIQVGRRLGPAKAVVTVAADSGLKYLNTGVYRHPER